MFSSARTLLALAAGAAAVAAISIAPASASPAPASSSPLAATSPHYDHVFVIVEENHGYTDMIGNPAAPNFNALAAQYGLATNYYAVTHPSEPNYVALLGGSTYGVNNDNAYYVNHVNAPSLISQFDQAGVAGRPTCRACRTPDTRASAIRRAATARRTRTRCTSPSTMGSRTSRPRGTRPTGRGRCQSSSWQDLHSGNVPRSAT